MAIFSREVENHQAVHEQYVYAFFARGSLLQNGRHIMTDQSFKLCAHVCFCFYLPLHLPFAN